MVPPMHGDTSLLDSPEKWKGKSLEEIVNFRLKFSSWNTKNFY